MAQDKPVIFFDGVCNYCNSMVNFVIRQDKKKVFRFAALQSKAGQQVLKEWNLPPEEFDSFLVLDNGKLYSRSTAVLQVANKLPWYWKWSQLFRILPRFMRDGAYNIIARNRYKWFGKKDQCMIPTPDVRERFLD